MVHCVCVGHSSEFLFICFRFPTLSYFTTLQKGLHAHERGSEIDILLLFSQ